MNFTVATHNDAKNPKGFIHYDDVEFSDIPQMVMNGCAYSAGKFKDNHRKNDNWLGCVDVLILDIDDGCTIKQAQEIFKKYEYFIITTRSHQKNKNGLICDRFRVFLNLAETIIDHVAMDNFMILIMSIFPFVDKSTKDRGRFYFAAPSDAEIFYNAGRRVQVIAHVRIEVAPIKPKEQTKLIKTSDNIYRFCELTNLWGDKDGNTLENGYNEDGEVNYEAKLKGAISLLNRDFYAGNRNNALFGCMSMLKNDGLDCNTIVNFAIEENDKRDGIPLRELMSIWKSVERL